MVLAFIHQPLYKLRICGKYYKFKVVRVNFIRFKPINYYTTLKSDINLYSCKVNKDGKRLGTTSNNSTYVGANVH